MVVLLAVWVQGCAAEDDQTTYGNYLADIGEVGNDSAKIGADLATLLTTPGLAQAELETKLGGFVQRQQLDVERARDLDAPGPLTPANGHAVEALELRVAGLQGLLDTFRATKDTDDQTAAGQQLAAWGERLEASDVVWKDLFQGLAKTTMATEGVEGLTAPASVFVENADLYTRALDELDLAARPRSVDGRDAERAARELARVHGGQAGGRAALDARPRRRSRSRPTSPSRSA